VRFFVTGIGGFAGLHLAECLLGAGHEVRGLVTGRSDRPGLAALARRHPSFRLDDLAIGNVTDPAAVGRALADAAPDGIFHLAGIAFVPRAAADVERTFAVNTLGTIHVLEAARALASRPRVLAVTSSFAYGDVDADRLPITEDTPLQPTTLYGVSKAAADMAAYSEWRASGLEVIRVRTFNHTGPGQSADFVCADFARQIALIAAGATPPVLATGNRAVIRDFTDVRDVVRGYALLLERGVPGEAYNLCSGVGTSVDTVIHGLADLAGVTLELVEDPTRVRTREVPAIVGSAARARGLGWSPAIPFRTTLTDLLAEWEGRATAVRRRDRDPAV
jgi:GDP-4-dehydro-6-deoxy-D-mannose reductase